MKVVINRCYGGFGLSKEARLELYKRGSKVVKGYEPRDYYGGKDNWKELFEQHLSDEWYGLVVAPDGKIISYEWGYENRSDPILVDVVEKMGEKANEKYAELSIVEIPDGTHYEIDDYDGMESIHETHRSWC